MAESQDSRVTQSAADSVDDCRGGEGHKAGCPVATGPTGHETPAPPLISQDNTSGRQRGPEHEHEWTALWDHFGQYGDQDAHFHVCFSDDHAPGYPCRAMYVGKGRDCVDGQAHEIREPEPRVRHG